MSVSRPATKGHLHPPPHRPRGTAAAAGSEARVSSRSGIPAEPTPLIGRRRETAEVLRLAATTRLLTLTGPGGVGKTRLALRVASRLADERIGEIRFYFTGEALATADADVLVVDGCDQRADAASQVAHALASDSTLRVITTSRRPLGVSGELVWRVPGLGHSEEDEAVRLFAARASAHRPGFAVTSKNVDVIRELCDEVDRIPLAIELAAGWTGLLPLPDLLARIRRDNTLLERAAQGQPEEHRSIDASLARTWELASAPARGAWGLLSIFDGDFDLRAAAAVAVGRTEAALLFQVRELADLGVLTVSDTPVGPRIRLLHIARRYGRAVIDATNDRDAARNRHLEWCIELAEDVDARWRGPLQTELFDRLETERVNLNQALAWACANKRRREPALRLAGALCWFWHLRGHVAEGRAWLTKALVGSRATTPARAKALTAAGFLAYMNGDVHNGLSLMEKSLALRRRLGDRRTFAFALLSLGILQFYSGHRSRAREMLEESIRLNRAVGDHVAAYIGLYELAELEAAQGEYERALQHHEESLRAKTAQGDRWHIAWSQFGIGLLYWMRGDYESAADYHRKSLATRRELQDWHGVGLSFEGLAWTAASSRQPERAARLLGAAEALWESLGMALPPYWREHHASGVASIKAALPEDKFRMAWTQGRTMDRDHAVDYALGAVAAGDRPAKPTARPTTWLTNRELEIAKLVARGLMNRQIAEVLGIAERTAESHVEHIRTKLDFNSRAQIAAWAVERGLTGTSEDDA